MSGIHKDIKNNVLTASSIFPQSISAGTLVGSAVDADRCGDGQAELQIGAMTGLVDCKIVESDTSGGTYTDVAGAAFAQQSTGSKNLQVTVRRSKRFLKASVTIGTGPALCAVSFELWKLEV